MEQIDVDEEEDACPGCGLVRTFWSVDEGRGVLGEDDEYYCCASCASGGVCDCSGESQKEARKLGAVG